MHLIRPLLIVSLVLNAGLVAFALLHRPAAPSAPQAQAAPAPDTPPLAQVLVGDDMRAIIERLRDEGFPPGMLHFVAGAKLNREFAARREALAPPPRYWRGISHPTHKDSNRIAERRALEDEYRAAYKELVGDLPRHPLSILLDRRAYGDLADDKIETVRAIENDYKLLREQLEAEMKGITFPDDKAQLELLDAEQRADFEKTLTPDELRAYDLRSSATAKKIRAQLKHFDASDAEYIALYDAQTVIDEQTAAEKLSADDHRALLESQARDILAPERFEEYRIKTHASYDAVIDFVHGRDLPQKTATDLVGLQIDATGQAAQIRADAALTPEQHADRLAALTQETTGKLKAALGEAEFEEYYKKKSTSGWLKQLESVPAR